MDQFKNFLNYPQSLFLSVSLCLSSTHKSLSNYSSIVPTKQKLRQLTLKKFSGKFKFLLSKFSEHAFSLLIRILIDIVWGPNFGVSGLDSNFEGELSLESLMPSSRQVKF